MIAARLTQAVRRYPVRAAGGLVILLFSLGGFAAFLLPAATIEQLIALLAMLGAHPWAPPLAILLFIALITLGMPQAALIAAMVAGFGPWAGFLYSWTGKVTACALGFAAGRRLGAGWIERHAGRDTAILMDELARHGFWASAVIRLVPTLPSIAINLAAGCTPMRFGSFIAGTALGSVPKMALIAFASHAAILGLSGAGLQAWLTLGGAVSLLVLLSVLGRSWLRRRARSRPAEMPD